MSPERAALAGIGSWLAAAGGGGSVVDWPRQ